MAEPGKKLLGVLLDRLYATLVNGPLMSCRPHSSRQRVDLFQLAKLRGPEPNEFIAALMGPGRSVKLTAPSEPSLRPGSAGANGGDEQKGLVSKLRTITEQVDLELSRIHGELTRFEQALAERPGGVAPSFHELVGSLVCAESGE